MKKPLHYVAIIISLFTTACDSQNKGEAEAIAVNSNLNQKTNEMKSHVSMFEIPAMEISRAVDFYQAILDIKIEQMKLPGMEMGLFPYEDQLVTGIIIKGEGYQPSTEGVTLYLNAGEKLDLILERVEKNGGKIILPKTAHADESGFFALFVDSEGNRLGLNSSN